MSEENLRPKVRLLPHNTKPENRFNLQQRLRIEQGNFYGLIVEDTEAYVGVFTKYGYYTFSKKEDLNAAVGCWLEFVKDTKKKPVVKNFYKEAVQTTPFKDGSFWIYDYVKRKGDHFTSSFFGPVYDPQNVIPHDVEAGNVECILEKFCNVFVCYAIKYHGNVFILNENLPDELKSVNKEKRLPLPDPYKYTISALFGQEEYERAKSNKLNHEKAKIKYADDRKIYRRDADKIVEEPDFSKYENFVLNPTLLERGSIRDIKVIINKFVKTSQDFEERTKKNVRLPEIIRNDSEYSDEEQNTHNSNQQNILHDNHEGSLRYDQQPLHQPKPSSSNFSGTFSSANRPQLSISKPESLSGKLKGSLNISSNDQGKPIITSVPGMVSSAHRTQEPIRKISGTYEKPQENSDAPKVRHENRTVFISNIGFGVGVDIAKKFLQEGYTVVVHNCTDSSIKAIKRDFKVPIQNKVHNVNFDWLDYDKVQKNLYMIATKLGSLRRIIHFANAKANPKQEICEEKNHTLVEYLMNENVKSTMNLFNVIKFLEKDHPYLKKCEITIIGCLEPRQLLLYPETCSEVNIWLNYITSTMNSLGYTKIRVADNDSLDYIKVPDLDILERYRRIHYST